MFKVAEREGYATTIKQRDGVTIISHRPIISEEELQKRWKNVCATFDRLYAEQEKRKANNIT